MLQIGGTPNGTYPMVCIIRASLTEIRGAGEEGCMARPAKKGIAGQEEVAEAKVFMTGGARRSGFRKSTASPATACI